MDVIGVAPLQHQASYIRISEGQDLMHNLILDTDNDPISLQFLRTRSPSCEPIVHLCLVKAEDQPAHQGAVHLLAVPASFFQ
jgi:hypothetical protein